MTKTIGLILFGICCISFLAMLIVPLLGFSAKQIAGITIVLLIIGEVAFYSSLFFLGKSFFNKIKEKLKFRKPKTALNSNSEEFTKINNTTKA